MQKFAQEEINKHSLKFREVSDFLQFFLKICWRKIKKFPSLASLARDFGEFLQLSQIS